MSNTKFFIVRGSFANQYELQNFEPLLHQFNLTLISSLRPLTSTSLPTIQLPSLYDLPLPFKKQIFNRLLGDPHYLLGLKKVIPPHSIVHTAETYYGYTAQLAHLKKQGYIKKLISTCWETIPHNNETINRKLRLKKQASKYIDHFITPTLKAKQALVQEGISPNKISLIRLGVDLSRFTPIPLRRRPKTVLFIGRGVPEKGIHFIRQLIKDFPNLHFLLIGKGRGLTYFPYSRIHTLYHQADIFILPSITTPTWEEQYGMVLIEALASGLPIITTSTGAIPEVVGQAALVVSPLYQQLKDALTSLIESFDKRARLSHLARVRAQKYFSHLQTAKKIAKLYNNLI